MRWFLSIFDLEGVSILLDGYATVEMRCLCSFLLSLPVLYPHLSLYGIVTVRSSDDE